MSWTPTGMPPTLISGTVTTGANSIELGALKTKSPVGRGASGWGRTHSRLGLLEMVQVKYVDVDKLSRWPKSWWYGYDEELGVAADRFLEFMFAPQWRHRWRSARGALRAVFRGHRI